jgi:hypothetical protein
MRSRAINSSNPCSSVQEFLKEFQKLRREWRREKVDSRGDGKPLWFRGQRSAKWDLRPRFYRDQYANSEESEIRLEFEGHGRQLATTNENRTKWEWYFLMQHYGAPTRLLDWTANPLAALYFAIAFETGQAQDDDAAVWVLDPWHWNKLQFKGLSGPGLPGWKETEPYLADLEDACDYADVKKRWPIAIEPPSIDRRLASQTARFLLFGTRKDLVMAANRIDKPNRRKKRQTRLAQILIARNKLERMQCELDDLGMNHRILFPDLQGLGEYLSWKWKDFPRPRRP